MNQRVKYLGQRSFGSKVIVRAHNQTEETGSIFLRRLLKRLVNISLGMFCSVLFCSLAVLDPRVGHTMNVLSPFIPVPCHSRESPVHPRLDVVHPGRAWSSSPPCIISCYPCFLGMRLVHISLGMKERNRSNGCRTGLIPERVRVARHAHIQAERERGRGEGGKTSRGALVGIRNSSTRLSVRTRSRSTAVVLFQIETERSVCQVRNTQAGH